MSSVKPVIRCSNLDRLLSCSGSRTMDARLDSLLDLGGEGGDAMTWRGNWCHYESARRLVVEHGAIAPDGLELPRNPRIYVPSEWDKRTVDWYVSNVLLLTPEDHAIFVERHITKGFPRFILSGHIDTDTISANGEEFTIDDDKTGPNEVDHAESNWQLSGYAVLLKHKVPTLKRGTVRIFQRDAEIPITEAPVDDLDMLTGFIERRINAALDAPYTLTTGYKQCRLCDPMIFCPTIRREIRFMQEILSAEEIEALKVTPDLKDLAEICAAGRAVAGPIERLMKILKERIQNEGPVVLADGTQVRIVEEDGRRSVSNTKIAFEFAKETLGEDKAWETLTISLKDLEDCLVETGLQRTSKTADSAQGWIKEKLSHLITRATVKKLKFT